jgi:hypothetical protein
MINRKLQNISLQPEEWEKVRRIAKLKNMTYSEYIRLVLRKHWGEI